MTAIQESDRAQVLRSVVETRRTIHQDAELGHHEWHTSELLERRLRAMGGYTVFRPAPTSVAALSAPAQEGLVVVRADIDALPLSERTGVPYASPQNMHACGHDGHTAAVLAAAELYSAQRPGAGGPGVLFVFQQAEETHPSGAPMVVEGLRERLGAALAGATCYGLHLWPELPAGTVGVRPGPIMASVASVTLQLAGHPGATHGSRAQADGTDALAAGVSLHRRLGPLLRGRDLSGGHAFSLHIGRFEAGERPQDTAVRAELRGTLRALSPDAEGAALAAMEEIGAEVAADCGATCALEVERNIRPALINDEAAVRQVVSACRYAGIPCEDYPPSPLGVSEDFGWYRELGPTAYLLLGCADDAHRAQLHDPYFDFDESVLLPAVEVLLSLIRRGPVELG
jgi:amidohydrolase